MKIEQLDELKKDVEEALKKLLGDKLRKVVLYGSYARGDYDEESDIDFAAIVNIPFGKVDDYDETLADIEVDLCLKYHVYVSILLFAEENFYSDAHVIPLFANIVKEGSVVYGR